MTVPGAKVEGIFHPGPASAQTENVTIEGKSGVLFIVRTPSLLAVTFWGQPDFLKMLDESRQKVTGIEVPSTDNVMALFRDGPKPGVT